MKIVLTLMVFLGLLNETARGHETSISIVDVATGKLAALDQILERPGSLVLAFEESCQVCKFYLKNLRSCELGSAKEIHVVALGKNDYLRRVQAQLPPSWSLHKIKERDFKHLAPATPLTFWKKGQHTGALECQELQTWLNSGKVPRPADS